MRVASRFNEGPPAYHAPNTIICRRATANSDGGGINRRGESWEKSRPENSLRSAPEALLFRFGIKFARARIDI